jgi:hypothetical protein
MARRRWVAVVVVGFVFAAAWRCGGAEDTRQAPVSGSPEAEGARLNLLQNARRTDVRTDPFPHVVVRGALPLPLYDQLAHQYPAPARILHGVRSLPTAAARPEWHGVSH